MEDVAEDGDVQPLDPAQFFPDGEDVEQRLGRVAVRPVPGVDDAAFEVLGDEVLRAGRAVPHDHQVHLECFDVAHGVQQRFAFGEAAALRLHIDDVGREPLFGQLERNAGTGAGFHEEVDHGFAAQGGNLLHLPFGNFLELFGGVEDECDLLGAQVVQPEQVFSGPFHHR
ncbi:hypothetical protein SDC9_163947 [bioreactor metagenome]|uniref:Uncharacterized protein n=1 Tax=bioreactor metagenome TaxID=1076179 RepID=A0A645FSJ8_9ZZZZ